MKKLAVTQRVSEVVSYNERRDALDQRWTDFLLSINLFPVLIPNNLEYAKKLINQVDLEGILLTGGNSLSKYGGDARERDQVETHLLQWSIESSIPVLGVCRGMQLIQDFFGNDLSPVTGHVGKRHELSIPENTRLFSSLNTLDTVNSYHDYGTKIVSGEIVAGAYSKDGVVMAVEHRSQDIYGIMWHSEREEPFVEQEQEIFNFVFR